MTFAASTGFASPHTPRVKTSSLPASFRMAPDPSRSEVLRQIVGANGQEIRLARKMRSASPAEAGVLHRPEMPIGSHEISGLGPRRP